MLRAGGAPGSCDPHLASVSALTAAMNKTWRALDAPFMKRVDMAFRPRLEAMVEKSGWHID